MNPYTIWNIPQKTRGYYVDSANKTLITQRLIENALQSVFINTTMPLHK